MGDLEKIMAETAEKIRREAYAAGWRDCVASITKAAAESAPSEMLADKDDRLDDGAGRSAGSGGGAAPTVGTTPHFVYSAVRNKPGMTGSDVVTAVIADGHHVAEASIRTTLVRLVKRGLVVNRHKRWYPT